MTSQTTTGRLLTALYTLPKGSTVSTNSLIRSGHFSEADRPALAAALFTFQQRRALDLVSKITTPGGQKITIYRHKGKSALNSLTVRFFSSTVGSPRNTSPRTVHRTVADPQPKLRSVK